MTTAVTKAPAVSATVAQSQALAARFSPASLEIWPTQLSAATAAARCPRGRGHHQDDEEADGRAGGGDGPRSGRTWIASATWPTSATPPDAERGAQ